MKGFGIATVFALVTLAFCRIWTTESIETLRAMCGVAFFIMGMNAILGMHEEEVAEE